MEIFKSIDGNITCIIRFCPPSEEIRKVFLEAGVPESEFNKLTPIVHLTKLSPDTSKTQSIFFDVKEWAEIIREMQPIIKNYCEVIK